MSQERGRLRALIEIGKELTRFTSMTRLMDRVMEVAAYILCADDCSLYLMDEDGKTLRLRASRGPLREEVGEATYQPGQGLTGWVAEHGEPVRLTDVQGDPRWQGVHEEFPDQELGALLAVPVPGRDQTAGVLRVVRHHSPERGDDIGFTEEDEDVLSTLASQLSVALDNARLVDRLLQSERMAAWGQVSARSAHMIGNRVFALQGHLNELEHLLQDAKLDPEALRELVTKLRTGLFRVEEILQEFRDFVLATEISQAPVDVNAVVREAIAETPTGSAGITLRSELGDHLPTVLGDVGKLKRCVGELIENSVLALKEGGEIVVTTAPAAPAQVQQWSGHAPRQPMVMIEVRDNGPGIAENLKERIFTPFFTTRGKGMGLGLSIVHGIVAAHHGTILEVGTEGEGARFVILLPTAQVGWA